MPCARGARRRPRRRQASSQMSSCTRKALCSSSIATAAPRRVLGAATVRTARGETEGGTDPLAGTGGIVRDQLVQLAREPSPARRSRTPRECAPVGREGRLDELRARRDRYPRVRGTRILGCHVDLDHRHGADGLASASRDRRRGDLEQRAIRRDTRPPLRRRESLPTVTLVETPGRREGSARRAGSRRRPAAAGVGRADQAVFPAVSVLQGGGRAGVAEQELGWSPSAREPIESGRGAARVGVVLGPVASGGRRSLVLRLPARPGAQRPRRRCRPPPGRAAFGRDPHAVLAACLPRGAAPPPTQALEQPFRDVFERPVSGGHAVAAYPR